MIFMILKSTLENPDITVPAILGLVPYIGNVVRVFINSYQMSEFLEKMSQLANELHSFEKDFIDQIHFLQQEITKYTSDDAFQDQMLIAAKSPLFRTFLSQSVIDVVDSIHKSPNPLKTRQYASYLAKCCIAVPSNYSKMILMRRIYDRLLPEHLTLLSVFIKVNETIKKYLKKNKLIATLKNADNWLGKKVDISIRRKKIAIEFRHGYAGAVPVVAG